MQGGFFLTNWFLLGMKWIYGNVESVFLTILIFTVLLRILTVFSDIQTRKSSAKMALIQPELQKLQKKYANDPQKLNAAHQKLMKDNGVSMWGSCLPMLITLPLFFCFIAAFRYWGYEETIKLLVSDNAEELLRSYKFLWVNNIWQPDNGLYPVIMEGSKFLTEANVKDLNRLLYLQENTAIWQQLVDIGIAVNNNGAYSFLTTEAAIAAYNKAVEPLMQVYAGYNNGWFILPILAGGTNFLSSWLLQRGQPQNDVAASTNKMMMYMFPIMSVWICLTSNSAFSVYWILSSLLMVVVNIALNKKYPRNTPVKEAEKK